MKKIISTFVLCSVVVLVQQSSAQVMDKIKDRSSQNSSQRQSAPSNNNTHTTPSYNNNNNGYNYNNNYNNGYNYNNNYPYNNNNNYNYNNNGYNNNQYSTHPYRSTIISGKNTSRSSSGSSAALGDPQSRVLDLRDSIPEIVSIELYNDLSISNSGKTTVYNPKLRLNKGLFSTEVRWYGLYERSSETGKMEHFNYLDWQIVQLNLSPAKKFKMTVGVGFTKEFYSNSTFFDWGFAAVYYPAEFLKFRVEYRNSKDFETKVSPRTLWVSSVEFKIFGDRHTSLVGYMGANVNYARFYDSVYLWTFGPTLYLRLQ